MRVELELSLCFSVSWSSPKRGVENNSATSLDRGFDTIVDSLGISPDFSSVYRGCITAAGPSPQLPSVSEEVGGASGVDSSCSSPNKFPASNTVRLFNAELFFESISDEKVFRYPAILASTLQFEASMSTDPHPCSLMSPASKSC